MIVLVDAETGERLPGIESVYIAAGRSHKDGIAVENYMAHDGFPQGCPDTDALMNVLAAQLGHVLYGMMLMNGSRVMETEFTEHFWAWLREAGTGYLDAQLGAGSPFHPPGSVP